MRGFGQKIGHFAGVNFGLALDSPLQQFQAAAIKGALEFGHKFKGGRG
jgi:hypothetical protein